MTSKASSLAPRSDSSGSSSSNVFGEVKAATAAIVASNGSHGSNGSSNGNGSCGGGSSRAPYIYLGNDGGRRNNYCKELQRLEGAMMMSTLTNCMSQKAQLPSLTGHRLKTRKRDEKKQYDPTGFREAVLEGLNEAGEDLDAVSKFLDTAGSKLDYRRYGVTLVEILIAGGLLAPGGIIVQDGDAVCQTKTCLFGMADSMEKVRAWEQVFIKLVRRYKYLEKMHEEEMSKILVYLKGFSAQERTALAQITALWLATGQIPATILPVLINEHQVKENIALDFLLELLTTLKAEKGGQFVINLIKKSGLETRLMEFFPANNQQQTEENFIKTFTTRDLPEVVQFRKAQAGQTAKKELQTLVREAIEEEKPVKDIITEVKDAMAKTAGIQEQDVVVMIWTSVMSIREWNKKEDLLQEQALRHIKKYIPIFTAFTGSAKSEMALLNKIQEFCYDNTIFLKSFNKIVLLLYKTDVVSEEVVLKWYRDGHSSRGWNAFMEQMKKFVEWLEAAEEGERAQHRALSDESLWSIGQCGLHPWLQDIPFLRTVKLATKLAVIETGASVRKGKLLSKSDCDSVLQMLGLLLHHPAPLLLDDHAEHAWQLVETIVDNFETFPESGAVNVLGQMLAACECGRMATRATIVSKVFLQCETLFLGRVEEVFLEELKRMEGDEHQQHSKVNINNNNVLQAVGQSRALFLKFLDFGFQYIRILQNDPNLLKCLRTLVSAVLLSVKNPVGLFPEMFQPLILSALSSSESRDEPYWDFMLQQSRTIMKRCPRDLKLILSLFPEVFKQLLLHSLHRKSDLHVYILPEDLTINEIF